MHRGGFVLSKFGGRADRSRYLETIGYLNSSRCSSEFMQRKARELMRVVGLNEARQMRKLPSLNSFRRWRADFLASQAQHDELEVSCQMGFLD